MIYDHICIPIFVWWIAVLPDFDHVENDQNLSKIAHTTKYHGYSAIHQKMLAQHGFTKGHQIGSMMQTVSD